jgi:hypothetical protein
MAALLAGRGKLLVFYDRDGIVYRNVRRNRDFKLAARLEFENPVPGTPAERPRPLGRVLLFGWVKIRSIVGRPLMVQAGCFTSEVPPGAAPGPQGHRGDGAAGAAGGRRRPADETARGWRTRAPPVFWGLTRIVLVYYSARTVWDSRSACGG